MVNVRTILVAGLLAVPIGLATAQDNTKMNPELQPLQGDWSMTSGTTDGFPIPPTIRASCRRVCKGDHVTVTAAGQVILNSRISVDSTSTPRTIDYELLEGPDKEKKRLGIYLVKDDMFLSCFGAPGRERPNDFSSSPGDRRVLSEWKREGAAPNP